MRRGLPEESFAALDRRARQQLRDTIREPRGGRKGTFYFFIVLEVS